MSKCRRGDSSPFHRALKKLAIVIIPDEGHRIPRRFFQRSDGQRLFLPFEKSEVIGPEQTRQLVLPYVVTGEGFYEEIPTSMVRGSSTRWP